MKGKRQEKILEIIRTNDIFFDAGDDFKGYS